MFLVVDERHNSHSFQAMIVFKQEHLVLNVCCNLPESYKTFCKQKILKFIGKVINLV